MRDVASPLHWRQPTLDSVQPTIENDNIFAMLAQFERELAIERTLAGLAAAVASGKKLGRPRRITEHRIAIANQLRDNGVKVAAIARELSVSRATVYRMLAQ